MAFPQGINFRATAGYVTDGTNEDVETDSGGSGNQNYPHTTAQGTNVGWETVDSVYQARDWNSGNDRRLAGGGWNNSLSSYDYRVDLPASGSYSIRVAMGGATYNWNSVLSIIDTTTSLGALCSGTTSAAQRFKDATNTEYTNVTWPGSNTAVSLTFSTTICRLRFGAVNSVIAHFYIESGGPNNVVFYLRA